jgi:hypothetical protein
MSPYHRGRRGLRGPNGRDAGPLRYRADAQPVHHGGEALAEILPDHLLIQAGARAPFVRGLYRLEYVRTKTAFAP